MVPSPSPRQPHFLLKVLQEQTNPTAKTAAANALLSTGEVQAIEPLIKALQDEAGIVRQAAASSLGGFGNQLAINPLINILNDGDHGVRKTAAASLAKLGEHKWQDWVRGEKDDFLRLAKSGDHQALSLVIQATDGSNSATREEAITAIAGIKNEQVIQALIKAAGDKGKNIRRAAILSLEATDPEQLVPVLIEKLNDPEGELILLAVEKLGKIGDQRAVQPLVKLLNTNIFRYAIDALGKLGSKDAVEPILKILGTDDGLIRVQTAQVLDELGESKWKGWVKGDYLDCLRLIKSDFPPAVAIGKNLQEPIVKRLISSLSDSRFYIRNDAAKALIEFAQEPSTEMIKHWGDIRKLINEPRVDDWQDNGRSNDCTGTYYDSGIGLNFPKSP